MENLELRLGREGRSKDVRLDELDEKIVWELAQDARLPNNALAERLHVSPSTTLTRVKAMRDSGVLSFHANVDFSSVGLPLQAIVAVRIRAQARASLKEYAARVIKLPPVINLFFLGGPDDFLIHVACTSPEQLRDFVGTSLSMDPVVASTQTNIVFEHLVGIDYMQNIDGFEHMRADIS